MKRYLPQKPLPPYRFIPGVHPHPKKVGGYSYGLPEPVVALIDEKDPGKNEDFRYGLDLFNEGHLWESHVYFEALWNIHGRTGAMADFLKAMIKFAAAGIKNELGQKAIALDHILRGRELLLGVKKVHGPKWCGFNLDEILQSLPTDFSHQAFHLRVENELFESESSP